MKYKFFKDKLKELIALKEGQNKVNEALNNISSFPSVLFFDKHEDLILELFKDAMCDRDDWIAYFIYERDMKFTNKNIIQDTNGKNIPFRNYKDLYNLIVE